MSQSVLLVEDEELVGTMVQMNLEGAGFEVRWIKDGRQVDQEMAQKQFDLILLDIRLPGQDGLSILKQLRQAHNLPIMMLTATSEVSTKVQALQWGADDYLPKPFDVTELIARVHALLRRSQAEREIPSDQSLQFGTYHIDLLTRKAVTNQGPAWLSQKEVQIIRMLASAQGRPVSRSDILEEVWGMDVSPTERTVDNFILKLRKSFEPDPNRPRHFITVRGIGYRLLLNP